MLGKLEISLYILKIQYAIFTKNLKVANISYNLKPNWQSVELWLFMQNMMYYNIY